MAKTCPKCERLFDPQVSPGLKGACPHCMAAFVMLETGELQATENGTPAAPEPPPLKVGSTLGGMTVLHTLGHGGKDPELRYQRASELKDRVSEISRVTAPPHGSARMSRLALASALCLPTAVFVGFLVGLTAHLASGRDHLTESTAWSGVLPGSAFLLAGLVMGLSSMFSIRAAAGSLKGRGLAWVGVLQLPIVWTILMGTLMQSSNTSSPPALPDKNSVIKHRFEPSPPVLDDGYSADVRDLSRADAASLLLEGLEQFQNGSNEKAVASLRVLVHNDEMPSLQDDALFWSAFVLIDEGRITETRASLNTLLTLFPQSEFAERARVVLAWVELNRQDNGD